MRRNRHHRRRTAHSEAPLDDSLLLFTPHVPRRVTTTGWTTERQRAFIAALARTGVVSAAARSVGMSPRSAYQLRLAVRLRAQTLADVQMSPDIAATLGPGYVYSFAAAWDRALSRGIGVQLDVALPVALEGERTPIVRRGRILGWYNKPNTRLAITALGAFRRYNEGPAYDHEQRTIERTHKFARQIETMFRRGPAHWPELIPESDESRRARKAAERRERAIYGLRHGGLVDPKGPAGHPPRTLAQRGEQTPAEKRRERRLYGKRMGGVLDPFGPADRPPRPLDQRDRDAP